MDRELEAFLDDARATLSAEVAVGGTSSSGKLEGIIAVATRCQAEDVETFRDTIHAIVDQLEVRNGDREGGLSRSRGGR